MIQQIKIENYKSIPSLELDLGRVNVFIGENGSGKTNILEAVALGSAAAVNKLDYQYLAFRGVRIVDAFLMGSRFSSKKYEPIKIDIKSDEFSFPNVLMPVMEDSGNMIWILKNNSPVATKKEWENLLQKHNGDVQQAVNEASSIFYKQAKDSHVDNFLIFAPENYFLRRLEEETQLQPLGIRGEGLFSHLVDLKEKHPDRLLKIIECLQLIDWVQDFEIKEKKLLGQIPHIRIRDRYLEEGIQYIDQRSSNEGFLYLLFYVTLFVSPHTPKFFAIDNIDNALNPKLCSKLIEVLVQLAKENDKQVIVTAHNPGLLDGLNLNDEEQRLFVISRNKLGHTKALRIEQKPSANGHEPVRLSEQFLRGYIGGLPKNF